MALNKNQRRLKEKKKRKERSGGEKIKLMDTGVSVATILSF